MEQREITSIDAGQRFDKYLRKLLPEAPDGFLYKMLRKKNIVLNGKKADGSQKIACGDIVTLYLSKETFLKFGGKIIKPEERAPENSISEKLMRQALVPEESIKADVSVTVIFENEHILLADKPAGLLTQKASAEGYSLNEWLTGYLLRTGAVSEEDLLTFHPSACNRLDRNTSGLVLCSKSVAGARLLGKLLRNRTMHKYYRTYVKGCLQEERTIEGYLSKDSRTNKVIISPLSGDGHLLEDDGKNGRYISGNYIKTRYIPLQTGQEMTLLEVELITGKSHQIRAHLANIGHPLLGDYKYGNKEWNDKYRKKYGISHQLLHAYRVEFPILGEPFADLSGKCFTAPLPELYLKLEKEI